MKGGVGQKALPWEPVLGHQKSGPGAQKTRQGQDMWMPEEGTEFTVETGGWPCDGQ